MSDIPDAIGTASEGGLYAQAVSSETGAGPVMTMPSTNAQIAALFDDLSDVLEIKKENWFKIRAYRRAAEAIRGLSEALESLVREGRDIQAIPGVGEAIATKIGELVTTGRVATYEREKGSLTEAFQLLVDFPGFGPKVAWQITQETGAETREELESALVECPPTWLPTVGEGSVEAILEHLLGQSPGINRQGLAPPFSISSNIQP